MHLRPPREAWRSGSREEKEKDFTHRFVTGHRHDSLRSGAEPDRRRHREGREEAQDIMASITPWRGQGNIAAALRYSTRDGRRNGLAITRSGTPSLVRRCCTPCYVT